MIKYIFFFILFCWSTIFTFFSCTKVETDNTDPVIEFLSFEIDKPLVNGHIVYTDSTYLLKSIFRDNEGLSSYYVKIWNAKMENEKDTFTLKSSIDYISFAENGIDSAIYNNAFQDTKIFGLKGEPVTVSTQIKIGNTGSTKGKGQLPILLGDHYLKVTLIDMSGRITKDSLLINIQLKPTPLPVLQ